MVDNPQAFPCIEEDSCGRLSIMRAPGMTLRDWFAGQIAAAYCTATDSTGMWMTHDDDAGCRIIANRSYRIADAMLAERERTPTT